ncbi:MAG: DM13 domain-containing protein [Actinomycetota bacterium]
MGTITKQVKDHRARSIAIAGAVVVTVAAGLFWFSPQSALVNRRVDEALPITAATAGDPSPGGKHATPGAEGPAIERGSIVLARGAFTGLEHETSGSATMLELEDGRLFLRLEDFETLNGPDLRVYLSDAPADGDPSAFDESFTDLGALKGNMGNQNYELPEGTDVEQYRSAVIWCRRFSVGFGAAPIVAG